MANSVVLRKLAEGQRHIIALAYFLIDTTAEITDSVIIDPAGSGTCDPVPILGANKTLTIEQIWYSLNNFDVYLEFDATTDTQAFVLTSKGGTSYVDFRSFGGIKDASGTGFTGKLQLTTIGATANTSLGTIILKVRKD